MGRLAKSRGEDSELGELRLKLVVGNADLVVIDVGGDAVAQEGRIGLPNRLDSHIGLFGDIAQRGAALDLENPIMRRRLKVTSSSP